jgi:hypothetical protein
LVFIDEEVIFFATYSALGCKKIQVFQYLFKMCAVYINASSEEFKAKQELHSSYTSSVDFCVMMSAGVLLLARQ